MQPWIQLDITPVGGKSDYQAGRIISVYFMGHTLILGNKSSQWLVGEGGGGGGGHCAWLYCAAPQRL